MPLQQQRFRIADDCLESRFDSVREGYAAFLSRYTWDWFCTFTFRVPTHPEAARKYYSVWLACLNRRVFGNGWWRLQKSVYWCLAYERHRSGALHMHALVGHPLRDLNHAANRLQFMDLWFGLGKDGRAGNGVNGAAGFSPAKGPGIARIFRADNRCAVSAYVSKYVVKGGEIDLGGSLGRFYAT